MAKDRAPDAPTALTTDSGHGRATPFRMGLTATAVFAVLLIGVPLLVLVYSSRVELRQAARQVGAERALDIAHLEAQLYEHALTETRALLTTIAQLPQLRAEADPAACNALLGKLLEAHSELLANLAVVNTDGSVRCSALPPPPGVDLGHRDWLRATMEHGGLAVGKYQIGLITGIASTNVARAVTEADGSRSGVVVAALGLDILTQRLEGTSLPAGSTISIVDYEGHLLASYPAPPPPTRDGEQPAWDPPVAIALTDATPQTFEALGPDGVQRIYAQVSPGRLLPPTPGAARVVVGLPVAALTRRYEAATNAQFGQFAIALVALLLLAGGLAHFDAVRPARRLAQAARRFAAGDADVRVGDPGGAREFLELARGFDAAADRTNSLLAALRLLSAGNRVLLRGDTELGLLEAMCRVAVEVGGYRSAHVVYRQGDDGMQVRAVAGDVGSFLRSLELHWADARAGQTPTPGAIFGDRVVVLNDYSVSSPVPALSQAAARTGVRAAIGLPLRVEGAVIGAFTIYAAQAGAFGPQEVEILEEMASDLAFGITTARLRERHLEADARLQQLLYFDQVTGLPNRRRFLDEFGRLPVPHGPRPALLVVYLGNYWDVAAALGPVQGDVLLQAVAERLRGVGPALLARIAQAEFALVLADGDATPADEVLARLTQPFPLPPIQVDLEASAGVAQLGQSGAPTADRLLQAARLAAHEARHMPARWRAADRDLEQQWAERLALAGELRAALGSPAFTLHVQPQLELRTGTICGVEALARWQHPQRGPISPAQFIDIAESTGLIGPLTWQVLELALALGRRYAASGLDLPIAVNISARNLQDAELIPRLRELLAGWSLPPDCLHLEVTETALMADAALSRRVLEELRTLGLPVYLDDFGTGYSSFAYMRELPLSGIKLDRAFIAAVDEPVTRRIVRTMSELGHALGLRVIAEGLENPDHLALLETLGCHAVQGYAIARPMPGEALMDWLHSFRPPQKAP